MDSWHPLPVREGRPQRKGPYEGVPGHLREPLRGWLEDSYYSVGYTRTYFDSIMLGVATLERTPLERGSRGGILFQQLMSYCDAADENFLDILHSTILVAESKYVPALDRMLALGGSVWTATPDGLQRRVDPVAESAYREASLPQDTASTELMEAWANAYGRQADASDAWDHAIKAVEAILIPVVVPNQTKPTLVPRQSSVAG